MAMISAPACDIGTLQSTIVNTAVSGVPGDVGKGRLRYAGLDASVLRASYALATDGHCRIWGQEDQYLDPDPGAPARRCILPYHPHVPIPMEVSSAFLNWASPSTAAPVHATWLAVFDSCILASFKADDGLEAGAA